MRRRRLAAAAGLIGLCCTQAAHGTLGIYEHGNGIAALGMGGISYSDASETTAISANPASTLDLGRRFDLGIDAFAPPLKSSVTGNAAGPDEDYRGVHRIYAIPQGGLAWPLAPRWAIGFTLISAGLGPDYPKSPFQRFGGAPRASLAFQSSSVVATLAFEPLPGQRIGIGFIPGYQGLDIKGLGFLSAASVAPGNVSDRGQDGELTVGFNVGWEGRLAPWLTAAAAYRSQNWTQKAHRYDGLLPDGGDLDLPAIYGGGFNIRPAPHWVVALEAQRYEYRGQIAFRNGIEQLSAGKPLGSADGPGFGLRNQNAYKLGLTWDPLPRLTLRVGYLRATQIVQPTETLFGLLAPVTPTTHYTAGATYRLNGWEITGAAYGGPKKSVYGHDSIPVAFGGGEANVTDQILGAGISLGHPFGVH